MLADAEKYAAVDKEKRESIDLKNQAETLCFEAEKELLLLKESIEAEKQENITKLIQEIRQTIQTDQLENLNALLEDLKGAMKEMIATKMDSESNPSSTSSLNDL